MESFERAELYVKGAIVGHLIGDALGYPYQNIPDIHKYPIEMVDGLCGEKQGSWSAPGAFCLATIASIVDYGGFDLFDTMERFNDAYVAGYFSPEEECYDTGTITAQSIKNFNNGMPADKCGTDGIDNECLTRILPVAMYFANSPLDELVKNVHNCCRLTHTNAICETTCAAYSLMIRNLMLQRAEKIFDVLHDFYETQNLNEHIKSLDLIKNYRNTTKQTGSKYIVDSFWSAWDSHVRNEEDYACCVTDAIYLGNDTNGTASLAGAVSGLSNGVNNIPYRWLKILRLNGEHMDLIQKFTNTVISRNFALA